MVLRAVQVGISIADLDGLEYGMVVDLLTEAANDDFKYQPVATQADFDRF